MRRSTEPAVPRAAASSAVDLRARRLLPALALALLLGRPVSAETLRYTLDIPDNQSVTYELDLQPTYPGTVSVRADWSGKRIVSFRLEPPDDAARTVRRSGPPPLELEAPAEEDQTGAPWKLVIHALAARGEGQGELTIVLPEKPVPRPREPRAMDPPKPAEPAWMRPWEAPRGVSEEMHGLYRAVDELRRRIAEAEPPDNCRWQAGLMQFFSRQRGQTPEVSRPTRRLLQRIVDAIAEVERFRNSSDPIVAGPAPEDDSLRRVWVLAREARFRELEQILDDLLFAARGGYAPDLEGESWPVRLVSCLTACERYFEESGSLGERRATNRELTQEQWGPIRASGAALSAYLAFGADPAIRALRTDRH